jgi:hypothetical protein
MYHTAQDLLEYLMNSTGGGAQDGEHRALRSAVQGGYRDVVYARDWNWHVSRMQLPSPVPGSNGKTYILPENVKDVDALIPPNRATKVAYVTPMEWQRLEAYGLSTGEPLYWTFMQSDTQPDRWEIRIAGNPSSINPSLAYWITYRRKPAPLRYMGYEPATRNGSLNETNAFGAVKRYGTPGNFPESYEGVHPFTAEEILGLPGSFHGSPPPPNCKTTVSDRLDVSDGMLTAVRSACEVWLAKLLGKNVEGALTVYARDLRLAFETDAFAPIAGRRTGTSRYPEYAAPPLASSSITPVALGYYSPSAPDDPGSSQ